MEDVSCDQDGRKGNTPTCVSLYYRCPFEKKRGMTKRRMVSPRSPIRVLCFFSFFLSSCRATRVMRNSAWLKCVSAGRPVHAFSVSVGAQSCISSSGNCSELPSRKGSSGTEIAGCSECGLACPCREDVPFWCNRGMIARSGIRVKSAPGMSRQKKRRIARTIWFSRSSRIFQRRSRTRAVIDSNRGRLNHHNSGSSSRAYKSAEMTLQLR